MQMPTMMRAFHIIKEGHYEVALKYFREAGNIKPDMGGDPL